MSLRATACVVGTLLALAACTAAGDAPAGQDNVDPSSLYGSSSMSGTDSPELRPVLSDDDSIPLGVTGELVPGVYALLGEPTAEQKLVLDQAFYLKVKKCMKDQGFTLLDPPPKLQDAERSTILFDGYIGILDEDYAKNFGYQLDMDSIRETSDSQRQSDQHYPSAEYESALKVARDGGCRGQAERAIDQGRPSEDESTTLLARIYEDSLQATYADEDYKKALNLWTSCMKSAGFNYATPLKAFSAFDGFQVTPDTMSPDAVPHPTASEVNTAIADVECKRSSRLADVFRRVFWGRQLAMAKKNRPTLKVLDEVNAQKLRNAQQIIKELG